MVFFFTQKTAYEMRISDWSSDVCSSDLIGDAPDEQLVAPRTQMGRRNARGARQDRIHAALAAERQIAAIQLGDDAGEVRVGKVGLRSEERRVGKECVST